MFLSEMNNNSLTCASDLIEADDTVTKIKEDKVPYENNTCDIEVNYTLNSSFSVIDRTKDYCKTHLRRSARNVTNKKEYIYPSAKKRKYNCDSDSRNIDDSVKKGVNLSSDLNGLEALNSRDLNTVIKEKSPKIRTKKIIVDDIEIKSEILSSFPINSPSNNEQSELTKDANNSLDTIDSTDTSISSEKYDECYSMVKNEKKKKNISVVLENIHKELEIAEKNEQLSDSDIEKLNNLHITLIHKVPPQHKIEKYPGSYTPTIHEQRLFEKYGPLRKGMFCTQEDQTIKKNWEMFCKLHNWNKQNVKPFLSFKHNGKFYIHSLEERQKFLRFLANGLPWRTLYSVYWRFKALHRERNNKRYSAEEDKKILAYLNTESSNSNKYRKFSDLAKILKRSKNSLWLHYQCLKERHNIEEHSIVSSQIKWTLSFINKYIQNLLKITRCRGVQELKNAIIPKAIWVKLQTKLNVNYKILRRFWMLQLHMQLFYPYAIYLNDIKIQLIEYVYGKGISNIRDIIWANVIKYFDGTTSTFLRKTFTSLMIEADVARHGKESFWGAIEYLYEKKIPKIKNKKTDKYLPRLQYTNGVIKIINQEKMTKIGHN